MVDYRSYCARSPCALAIVYKTLHKAQILDPKCATTFRFLALIAECRGDRTQSLTLLERSSKLGLSYKKITTNDFLDCSAIILSRIQRRSIR